MLAGPLSWKTPRVFARGRNRICRVYPDKRARTASADDLDRRAGRARRTLIETLRICGSRSRRERTSVAKLSRGSRSSSCVSKSAFAIAWRTARAQASRRVSLAVVFRGMSARGRRPRRSDLRGNVGRLQRDSPHPGPLPVGEGGWGARAKMAKFARECWAHLRDALTPALSQWEREDGERERRWPSLRGNVGRICGTPSPRHSPSGRGRMGSASEDGQVCVGMLGDFGGTPSPRPSPSGRGRMGSASEDGQV